MEWTLATFFLANLILILGSILQMATGVSMGMIVVPFLAMISYTLVPVPIIFASLPFLIMMVYKGRKHIDTQNMFQINIGMILGVFVAVYLLKNIHFDYLGILFGLFILLSVFISMRVKSFKLSSSINYTGAFLAGLMGAMAAVGGQILALLFQNHPLESIKATLAFLYLMFSIVMLVVFYIFGEFSKEQMISSFYIMPGFIIGFFIAPIFTQYINPKYAKTMVLGMATLGALILIGKGLL